MPPLPKKKRTHAKKGTRWSHSQLAAVALSTCPQCHVSKPPHLVCDNCGYYGGREVISVSARGAREETSP
jgi:large subunit ribosomal protein L32